MFIILIFSPQTSSSFTTLVTAIVEIHCVKSSEQFLMAMLKAALKKEESIFEPDYFKLEYPSKKYIFKNLG